MIDFKSPEFEPIKKLADTFGKMPNSNVEFTDDGHVFFENPDKMIHGRVEYNGDARCMMKVVDLQRAIKFASRAHIGKVLDNSIVLEKGKQRLVCPLYDSKVGYPNRKEPVESDSFLDDVNDLQVLCKTMPTFADKWMLPDDKMQGKFLFGKGYVACYTSVMAISYKFGSGLDMQTMVIKADIGKLYGLLKDGVYLHREDRGLYMVGEDFELCLPGCAIVQDEKIIQVLDLLKSKTPLLHMTANAKSLYDSVMLLSATDLDVDLVADDDIVLNTRRASVIVEGKPDGEGSIRLPIDNLQGAVRGLMNAFSDKPKEVELEIYNTCITLASGDLTIVVAGRKR